MNGPRKSDRPVVPATPSNKADVEAAERGEGRGLAKENSDQQNASRTQSRTSASSALDRVRQVAARDKTVKFTALLHHVSVDLLRAAFGALRKKAAPGIDGVTWEQYEADLEGNLQALHARLHRGAYRVQPCRRVFIPRPDGRQRPLGIASLEDKVVQRAVVQVLNAIYEQDAVAFQRDLAERLRQFSLELHPTKTRLLRFGRFVAVERQRCGLRGSPETFSFLGFTHICGRTRQGAFLVLRRTQRERMRAKLKEVKAEMMRRRHLPLAEQGKWLGRVVRGYFAYHAVPTNIHALASFRTQVSRHWRVALGRRSQRGGVAWKRMKRLEDEYLLKPRVLHPWPEERFDASIQGKSRVR